MDSHEWLLATSIDPNLDPQLAQLMEIPLQIKAEPDEAQTGIATAVPDVSSWPHGDCWQSSRPIEPTFWAPNAKLCDCPEHSETTWPAEHAILFIPDCAKRCPYCPWKTDKSAKVGNPAPMVRRHIRQYHLKHGNYYPGISVESLRVYVYRHFLHSVSYELTQGGRPTLENTEQA
ncbi:uncharacterized protein N7487_005432 [Penicillium crustosum]|uniref:uncharacterized protein n=1 Tax=Penicillium crustosum TaxID=36656 RepID=UPI00239974D9|nr:uncharacterized protein N7487_005432 [Penicillium crustosum]KAJ5411073.1 hypothetical protein N7487_005432 [Penicillium crustosum]